MKLRVAWVVGFLTGVLLAGCGKDPATIHGTALYVVAYFKTSGYDIRSLYFSGQTPGGNDLFEATYRPMTPAATSLVSPQRVRVFLGDELGGDKVTVSLYAVDREGALVQFGFKSVVVERGREVEVKIEMEPFDLPTGDGGTPEPDAGFFDAGYIDAGRLQDGGVLQCTCDGGCCFPGTSTCVSPISAIIDAGAGIAPLVFTFNLCGPSGAFCSLALCDTTRTNLCVNGTCSCGKSGSPCPQGTRCSVRPDGQATCVCDPFSQCNGCCNPSGVPGVACVNGNALSRVACGSAGQACQPCGVGSGTGGTGLLDAGTINCQQGTAAVPPVEQLGVCSTSTSCAGCSGASQCCSEMKCGPAGWPRCKRPNANVCLACDLLRTDSCSAPLGCACGKETMPCSNQQFCDRAAPNGPRCKNF